MPLDLFLTGKDFTLPTKPMKEVNTTYEPFIERQNLPIRSKVEQKFITKF